MSDNAAHVLRNNTGMEVHVLRTGAVIQRIIVPDKNGHLDDVVLGFDDEAAYKVGPAPLGLGRTMTAHVSMKW
jgi:aldose 1-epimerase